MYISYIYVFIFYLFLNFSVLLKPKRLLTKEETLIKVRNWLKSQRQSPPNGKYIFFNFIRSFRYRQRKSVEKLRNRCRDLEKELEHVQQKDKQLIQEESVASRVEECSKSRIYEADSCVRRRSSQIRKMMPRDPQKAVAVLRHVYEQYRKSPRKQKFIKKMWPEEDKKLGRYMYLLGKYRNQKKTSQLQNIVCKIKWQYKSLRRACKNTDMTWSQFHKYTLDRKQVIRSKIKGKQGAFSRKLESDEVDSIRKFLTSEEASFPLPDRKYAGKRFMRNSMSQIRNMYNLLHSTTRKISLSTLYKYKPKSVKLQGRIPFRQSCCEVCQNFESVISVASKHLQGIPSTLSKCVDSSMCQYNAYFCKFDCALRKCSECGCQKLKEKLFEMNKHKLSDKRKRFMVKQWENKKDKIGKSDKYKTFMHWSHPRFTYKGLIEYYIQLLENMGRHSFFASWNYHHYLQCKKNLELGELLSVLDYSQNYLCIHQNEVQALHWSHAQVTMHPFALSYRCPVEGCCELVLHEVVVISDDLKHDAHLVKKMTNDMLAIVKKRGVEVRKMYEYTDQAPSQYKNKTAFRYLAEFKIPTVRNYFGVRHGKGPCDACTGRVKKRLVTLVKNGEEVINSPETCYDVAKRKLQSKWPARNECAHYLLNFVYTKKLPSRPINTSWKGIKDSRDEIHSVMNTGQELKVNYRKVSCNCRPCMDVEGGEQCKYSLYYTDWCGWDLSKFKITTVNLEFWAGIEIRKIIGSALDCNWGQLLDAMSLCSTYDELHTFVLRNYIPAMDCFVSGTLTSEERNRIDMVALHYRPSDIAQSLVPVKVVGDGNCLPRSVSHLAFKNEERHNEIRVRIVYEAVTNARFYVNDRYLARGAEIIYPRSGPSKQIAMYSSGYTPPNPVNVGDIYKNECLEISKRNSYCGLWQICQSANILRRPLWSVYPENLNRSMRLDMHRKFYCINNNYNNKECLHIMWTPMQVSANRYPCHFAPLMHSNGT